MILNRITNKQLEIHRIITKLYFFFLHIHSHLVILKLSLNKKFSRRFVRKEQKKIKLLLYYNKFHSISVLCYY